MSRDPAGSREIGDDMDVKKTIVPMLHVPDVRQTVDWYRDIGFEVTCVSGIGGHDDLATLEAAHKQNLDRLAREVRTGTENAHDQSMH